MKIRNLGKLILLYVLNFFQKTRSDGNKFRLEGGKGFRRTSEVVDEGFTENNARMMESYECITTEFYDCTAAYWVDSDGNEHWTEFNCELVSTTTTCTESGGGIPNFGDPYSNPDKNGPNALFNLTNGIGQMLAQIGSEGLNFKWTLDNKPLPGYEPAITEIYSDGSVTTFLDIGQMNNASTLAIASIIAHEAIHAWLEYKYQDGTVDQIYSELFENYYNENTEHMYIAKDFFDDLSAALASIDNNSNSNSFYDALAWGACLLS